MTVPSGLIPQRPILSPSKLNWHPWLRRGPIRPGLGGSRQARGQSPSLPAPTGALWLPQGGRPSGPQLGIGKERPQSWGGPSWHRTLLPGCPRLVLGAGAAVREDLVTFFSALIMLLIKQPREEQAGAEEGTMV